MKVQHKVTPIIILFSGIYHFILMNSEVIIKIGIGFFDQECSISLNK